MSTMLSPTAPVPSVPALLQPRTLLIAVLASIALLFAATTLRSLANPDSHRTAADDRSSILLDR